MSGITNPAEEYFKDGLWGWVTSAWKKLVATAGGALHIQFAGQEADVEVAQTVPADLTPGICGWDGSAWRKLPLVWGYSEQYHEVQYDLTPTAAEDVLLGSPVDAGEVWVVHTVIAYDRTTVCTYIQVGSFDGAAYYAVKKLLPTAIEEACNWSGKLVLVEGDKIFAEFKDMVANDDLYLHITGYKMKIAE